MVQKGKAGSRGGDSKACADFDQKKEDAQTKRGCGKKKPLGIVNRLKGGKLNGSAKGRHQLDGRERRTGGQMRNPLGEVGGKSGKSKKKKKIKRGGKKQQIKGKKPKNQGGGKMKRKRKGKKKGWERGGGKHGEGRSKE